MLNHRKVIILHKEEAAAPVGGGGGGGAPMLAESDADNRTDALVPERTAFERVKKWIWNLFKGSKDV